MTEDEQKEIRVEPGTNRVRISLAPGVQIVLESPFESMDYLISQAQTLASKIRSPASDCRFDYQ